MIEKMNFLSITGPKADIDRVVNTYLCKYEIHLENALSELTTVESLTPFLEVNPYRDALNSINTIYEELKTPPSTSNRSPGIETALSTVKEIRSQADQLQKEQSELEEKCSSLEESLRIIRPFRNIDYDISSILHLKYIHFHFGRIEKQYYEKFKKYIYDNLNTIFLKCDEDDQYVWGVYFVPKHDAHKIDAAYSSMHFEKIFVPDNYTGTAQQAFSSVSKQYEDALKHLEAQKQKYQRFLADQAETIVTARNTLLQFSDKRYGRHTVHRPQPQSRYDILKSKDTSEHQTEKCGKDSGAADDSGKIDMLQLVQEQSSDKEQESLSCITEHGSENKGVGDGNKPGRVHLAIGGKSVHFYIHFKGLEKLRVFQLGRRLMVLVVLRRIGIFSVYQAEDFFVG